MHVALQVLALLAAVRSVVGQLSLPGCVETCATNAAKAAGCSLTDLPCVCKMNSFLSATERCSAQTCTSSTDEQQGIASLQAACAAESTGSPSSTTSTTTTGTSTLPTSPSTIPIISPTTQSGGGTATATVTAPTPTNPTVTVTQPTTATVTATMTIPSVVTAMNSGGAVTATVTRLITTQTSTAQKTFRNPAEGLNIPVALTLLIIALSGLTFI